MNQKLAILTANKSVFWDLVPGIAGIEVTRRCNSPVENASRMFDSHYRAGVEINKELVETMRQPGVKVLEGDWREFLLAEDVETFTVTRKTALSVTVDDLWKEFGDYNIAISPDKASIKRDDAETVPFIASVTLTLVKLK